MILAEDTVARGSRNNYVAYFFSNLNGVCNKRRFLFNDVNHSRNGVNLFVASNTRQHIVLYTSVRRVLCLVLLVPQDSREVFAAHGVHDMVWLRHRACHTLRGDRRRKITVLASCSWYVVCHLRDIPHKYERNLTSESIVSSQTASSVMV